MIKFRGTTPEGKVVEGYYVKVTDKHFIIPAPPKISFCANYGEGCFGVIENDSGEYPNEVLPSSLAMYVGIDDKNGKKIWGSFEVDGVMSEGGDRAKNERGETGIVVFSQGAFVLVYEPPHNWDPMEPIDGLIKRWEVIPKEQENG